MARKDLASPSSNSIGSRSCDLGSILKYLSSESAVQIIERVRTYPVKSSHCSSGVSEKRAPELPHH